jgi:hypothetical protein
MNRTNRLTLLVREEVDFPGFDKEVESCDERRCVRKSARRSQRGKDRVRRGELHFEEAQLMVR